MAALYGSIANGGTWIQPHVTAAIGGKPVTGWKKRQLVSPHVASGAARHADGASSTTAPARRRTHPGYSVAGKTGTTPKYDAKHGSYCDPRRRPSASTRRRSSASRRPGTRASSRSSWSTSRSSDERIRTSRAATSPRRPSGHRAGHPAGAAGQARPSRRAQPLDSSSRGARRAVHGRGRRLACGRRDGRRRRRRYRLPLGALRAPGRCSAACPGRSADGHDFAPAAVANGAVALLVERELPTRRAADRDATTRAPAWRCWPTRSTAHPSRELDVVGVTGTNGKTTTTLLLAAMLDAAQRPLRPARHRRAAHRRAPRGRRPDDAGGARPAARAALDDRGGRRGLRDGGLLDRDRAAAARRHAVRGGRLHEPLAGPPRLPRRPRGATSRPRPRSSTVAARAPSTRTTPAARVSTPSCASASSRRRRTSRCEAFELRPDRTELFVRTPQGALSLEPRLRGRFNVDNVLCAVDARPAARGARWAPSSTPWRRPARRPGRFEPVDGGPGLRRDRRLRAHALPASPRCWPRRGRWRAAGCCACSAPAATATRPSARSWARPPRRAPTVSTSRATTRARSRTS